MTAQPQPRDDFFRELREKTADYHNKLEETALSQVILSEKVTMEAYIDYLKTMYAYTKPLEETFFPLMKDVFSNLDLRERSHLLEKDLFKLGVSATELDEADFAPIDMTASPEEMAGAIYVMEGSSLGGRVIFKHIHKTLGLEADTGGAYFYGHGGETGKFWTSFMDELWDFASQHSQQEIFQGAVNTFKDMYNLFNRQAKYAF